ncbi:hypothetical protein F4859DRAFT_499202 [Xylaria cf. heliscus]|nr:hypothetical protein F4859DRAFT_499202 [Xylaria cf. heliscus]
MYVVVLLAPWLCYMVGPLAVGCWLLAAGRCDSTTTTTTTTITTMVRTGTGVARQWPAVDGMGIWKCGWTPGADG